jgi:hypothetical protein
MNQIFLCDILDKTITSIYLGALMENHIKKEVIEVCNSIDWMINVYDSSLDEVSYKVNYTKL